MSPQSNENLGLQLPAPVAEPMPNARQSTAETAPAAPERAVAAPQAPLASSAAPAAAPISVPIPATPQPNPATDVASTTNSASTLLADDNDLIEKEWVNKAKQIVERTRDDPYKQSEELTGVKVDYMQKRYNKTIKLS